MDLRVIMKTAHSVSVEIDDGGIYNTKEAYELVVNGKNVKTTDTVVTSIYDLDSDTDYELGVKNASGEIKGSINFKTDYEFTTLNVKAFGAKGDGVNDDTKFIQAAIMACPEDSRVLIPEGTYKISSIFLKSDVNIELAKGAVLEAFNDRKDFPVLPGKIEAEGDREYLLGSWEGDPMDAFAAIICGINAKNVTLYGEGVIDGCASTENWWKNPKDIVIAARPRLLFVNHCDGFRLQGITVKNSPSWTIHPYFSNDVIICGITINNPAISPNTDGIDPESCHNLDICGVHFSLGDDCIAVKSGKIYMGMKYGVPCSNLHIYQCLMEDGHGAVTVGSEMAGGVNDLVVEKCKFMRTDRGLRIKSRRGRGKNAILDNIIFKDIEMDNVMTPFTANSFYFCDPDGKSDYVQSREIHPVDDRTPALKRFVFENIHATNAHVAAIYFLGLPEAPVEELIMKNVTVSFAENAKSGQPVMACLVDDCSKKGVHAEFIDHLVLDNVTVEGNVGEMFEIKEVKNLEKK